MVKGMFNKERLVDIVRNFIYFPDTSKEDIKILCRYPQYYAARKLFDSIKETTFQALQLFLLQTVPTWMTNFQDNSPMPKNLSAITL
jgi:hypothetical protein